MIRGDIRFLECPTRGLNQQIQKTVFDEKTGKRSRPIFSKCSLDNWLIEWRDINFSEWKTDQKVLNKYRKNLAVIISEGIKAKRDKYLEYLLLNDSKFTHNEMRDNFENNWKNAITILKKWLKDADNINIEEEDDDLVVLNKENENNINDDNKSRIIEDRILSECSGCGNGHKPRSRDDMVLYECCGCGKGHEPRSGGNRILFGCGGCGN